MYLKKINFIIKFDEIQNPEKWIPGWKEIVILYILII